jgi:tetratricopeptide (TPR) repeat protein
MLFLLFICSIAHSAAPTDSLLNLLKLEIRNKAKYDNVKLKRIKALKEAYAQTPLNKYSQKYVLCDQLYHEYKDFIFDSAHVYADQLVHLSLQTRSGCKQHESRIKLSSIQLAWGMFKEAFEGIDEIRPAELPDSLKVKYYELKSVAYTSLTLYNTNKFYVTKSHTASIKALDSALMYSKPDSYEYLRHTAEKLNLYGRKKEAIHYYKELLKEHVMSTHQRAMISHDLSNLTNGSETIELIIKAAIYDIRSSTKETLAISTIGNLLLKQGRLDDAEILLTEALSQAQFYGNKLHSREIIAALTTLKAQKLINSQTHKNRSLTALIVILIPAVASTLLMARNLYSRLKKVKQRENVVKQQNKRLGNINKKLLEDAHIKEEYIGYFFDVIAHYITRLEKIKRGTERHVKAKNYEEIIHLANEIDIKHERHQLFYTFDSVFLKLFPNFISTFNTLLNPEDQIWPKDHEVLNTSLRIFALIRLGVKDNQKIADILQSSVSTIYTYKKRIKAKALVTPDEFETKIMEIQFVQAIPFETEDAISHL